jgi:hypothetical protein
LTTIQNPYLGPGKRLPWEELIAIFLDVAPDAVLPAVRRMRGHELSVEDLEAKNEE